MESKEVRYLTPLLKEVYINSVLVSSTMLSAYMGVIQLVECYIWDVVVTGSNPVTHTNGVCGVIG